VDMPKEGGGPKKSVGYPESLEEAITSNYNGFTFSHTINEDGVFGKRTMKLQIFQRAGVDGVGIRLHQNTEDLELPANFDIKDMMTYEWALLFWWDTDSKKTYVTQAGASKKCGGAETVSITDHNDNIEGYCAPKRCGAQLVSCAQVKLDEEGNVVMKDGEPVTDANCKLMDLYNTDRGKGWPCLVQTRRIQRGEELKYVYNSDPSSDLYKEMVQWSQDAQKREAAKAEEKKVVHARMRANRKNVTTGRFSTCKRARGANGKYEKKSG